MFALIHRIYIFLKKEVCNMKMEGVVMMGEGGKKGKREGADDTNMKMP